MFGRILLALDATSSAQDVVALGQAVAAQFGGSLLLFHVLGAPTSCPDNAKAQHWLASYAAQLRAEGFAVSTVLRDGPVDDALAAVAGEQGVDLIILGRHAQAQQRSKLPAPELRRPHLSAQLLSRAYVPVLVISPYVNTSTAFRFLSDHRNTRRAIAVALDGSELAERALPIAVEVARGLDQHLHLVRVVPHMTPDAPAGATSAIRRMAIQTVFADVHTAHEYLAEVRRTVVATTPVHVQKRVLIGGVAEKLLEAASPTEVGLLVLTTHGRGALARAVMGSITAALFQEARVPLLIVPPTMHDQSRSQPSMEQPYALADNRAEN